MADRSAITGINPTFTLRKIDPHTVCSQYLQGIYATTDLMAGKTRLPANISTTTSTIMGGSAESEVFSFRDKSNAIQVVASTGHKQFQIFSNQGTLPQGGKCDVCDDIFTHTPLGIITKIVEEDRVELGRQVHVLSCYCDNPKSCSFECVYFKIKRHLGLSYRYRSPAYMDAESLLKHVFAFLYPGQELHESNDPVLDKRNSGPLDSSELKRHKFYRSTNIVTPFMLVPIKTLYVQS